MQNQVPGFRRACCSAALVALLVTSSACGTIMHPERKGQTSGRIDPGVAVLNGVGLLFFFIPGVIAYAVDFSNGTIYLPNSAASVENQDDLQSMTRVVVADGDLTAERIRAIVQSHVPEPIPADAPVIAQSSGTIGDLSPLPR